MSTISTDMTAQPSVPPPVPPARWTVAELLDQLGGIPSERVHLVPGPGTATEQDVLDMEDHADRICELIDGTLVEKDMGFLESRVATRLSHHIESYLDHHKLGIVVGEAGFLRLFPGQVRAPDVSFIHRDRFPQGRVPQVPIAALVPDLPVEVLSKGNTRREMERKLREYFTAGARLVWYIHPRKRKAWLYTAPEQYTEIGEDGILSGGDVLPGFELSLRQLLAEAEVV